MKRSVALLFLLLFLLCGCGKVPASEGSTEADIFYSDATAIDFLEGNWANSQGEYLIASRGDGPLIVWETNLSIAPCDLYVLDHGILKGGTAGSDEIKELLHFEKLDENSIQVENLMTGSSHLFMRGSLELVAPETDKENGYESMSQAAEDLLGMWMNESGGYFILAAREDGSLAWNSDLEMPACDYIDFYDGSLCAVAVDEKGSKSYTSAYTFEIVDSDQVTVTSVIDGSSSSFYRLSTDLDLELLNSRYTFANPQRAFVFLEGLWKDNNGNYFVVENMNGNIRWNTNLSLPRHQSYTFANGGMVGLDQAEDGSLIQTEIYSFTVCSQDQVEIRISGSDTVYTLDRQK